MIETKVLPNYGASWDSVYDSTGALKPVPIYLKIKNERWPYGLEVEEAQKLADSLIDALDAIKAAKPVTPVPDEIGSMVRTSSGVIITRYTKVSTIRGWISENGKRYNDDEMRRLLRDGGKVVEP